MVRHSKVLVEPMGFEPTTSSMPSRRAPSCATAPPLQALTWPCNLPGFTETRSQLRHGPTVTSSYLALQPSRFHRDALPAAPRPHRTYRENSITRFEGTVGTDLKVGHYNRAKNPHLVVRKVRHAAV